MFLLEGSAQKWEKFCVVCIRLSLRAHCLYVLPLCTVPSSADMAFISIVMQMTHSYTSLFCLMILSSCNNVINCISEISDGWLMASLHNDKTDRWIISTYTKRENLLLLVPDSLAAKMLHYVYQVVVCRLFATVYCWAVNAPWV